MDMEPDGPPWTALAGILLDALGESVAQRGSPTWVQVQDPPGGSTGDFCLVFDEESPGFLGWTAPLECQAVGVVASGRAVVPEGPVEPLPGFLAGTETAVRLACVVARDGSVGWQMETAGKRGDPAPPTEGRVLDCLRRCFGLPTPPPPVGPGHFQSLIWLVTIEEAVRATTRRLTWNQVLDLHPAANPHDYPQLAGPDSPGEPEWTWEKLRRAAVRDNWAWMMVDRELAAWMDDGMFARWILDTLPSPEDVLAELRPRLAPSTARRLAHAVRAA